MNPTSFPSSTITIHERPNPPKEEARVVHFEELRGITTLVASHGGQSLIKCFQDTVICHYVLYKNGVRHHDITPSNLMYKKDGDTILGVLVDFDLANG